MMDSDNQRDEENSSKLHWWGGALSGGATVPWSWAAGGCDTAKEGIKGAVIGGLIGLNGLFDDDTDEA